MGEQQKIRIALAKLSEVLSDIAGTAEEKSRERCPYKTAALRCTYRGGCRNQRRDADAMNCGGDFLNFEPVRHEP